MNIERLDKAIRAVCPIHGVNASRIVSFKDEATSKQRAAGQVIADGWDFDTPTAEEIAENAETTVQESLRTAVRASTAMQKFFTMDDSTLRAYVRMQINAASVDDLASAKVALAKCELFFEHLAVIVAALGRQGLKGD